MVLIDTGSTDETVPIAHELDVVVRQILVQPWRFDDARNAGLALVDPDIDWIITVDMDEVLAQGWREKFDKGAARAAELGSRRMSYDYTWNWEEDGSPDIKFRGDRCHTRTGWRWVGPVHEVLAPSGWVTRSEEAGDAVYAGFGIEHYPDDSKSRGSYLGLLKLAALEEPHNPRQAHYLARELFFAGDWVAAREEFVRYLGMPEATWRAERAQSYRYIAAMDDDPERWLRMAVEEDSGRRDALVDLVDFYVRSGRWDEARELAKRALTMTTRPGDYMTTAHAYDDSYLYSVIRVQVAGHGQGGGV